MNISSKLLKPKTCLGILLFFVLLFIFWISFWRTFVRPHEEAPHNFYIEDSIRQSSPRTILLWNYLFKETRWKLPADTVGPSFFKFLQCPEYDCLVTNNENYLPSIDMFDVLLVDGSHMLDNEKLPPTIRNPAQLYVFHTIESPLYSFISFWVWKRLFNLTMTCRLDSDIPLLFGLIEDIESGLIVAPALKPHWRQPPTAYTDQKIEAIAKAKTKLVVWFVSNCKALSRRQRVVKNLQNYVSVDVYGACGPLQCKRYAKECDIMVDRDYKFYIAFENSMCHDYVSEKLFNALRLHVIPVVLGGADYSRFAPPHSYIDANDFTNAKQLADYLKHLSDNPKEYLRYFWWRKYYRVSPEKNWCSLCAQIHTPNGGTKQHVVTDMESWWMNTSCYMNPRISLEE